MRTASGLALMMTIILLPCAASAQQVRVQCGPSAAVITTPVQQQALVILLQHQPLRPYTIEQRGGRPFVVYEDGQSFGLIPDDEFMRDFRDGGGGDFASAPTEPDEAHLRDIEFDEFPMSKFCHVYEYQTPVRSQSVRGMCHAFAATALLESLIKRDLMSRGVPEQLAEIDLSEEWLSYQGMKDKSERYSTPRLESEGHFSHHDLERVLETRFPLEAYWPYDPRSWPDLMVGDPPVPELFCGEKFLAHGECAWEFWGHRDRGQLTPASIGHFRERVAPAGPILSVTCKDIASLTGVDLALETAKDWLRAGRPVILSMHWPNLTLANDTMTLYYVPDDYPFDLQEIKAKGERDFTEQEEARWDTYYGGGHALLIIGYGKPGSAAEGIWMVKNSHGLNSGDEGIVYMTDALLRLSFKSVVTAALSDQTKSDLARFADTITGG